MKAPEGILLDENGQPWYGPVRRADSFGTRLMGLMGSPPGFSPGFWFEPCAAVHGCFMRYDLRILFLDKTGLVLRDTRLKPWGIALCKGAAVTVEVPWSIAAPRPAPRTLRFVA
jgi:hypothetical protein